MHLLPFLHGDERHAFGFVVVVNLIVEVVGLVVSAFKFSKMDYLKKN